ncbi:MAG TPA: ABC transporter permease [Gemmatimonadaceae bacterium]|nr:ABC transporter permease [Gemmatimonadaceae bacterium]
MSSLLESLRYDVSYAVRGLARSPGLTATLVTTFALGIGVNAAMFTVVDRVFFQAPPGLSRPQEVRRLLTYGPGFGGLEYIGEEFSTTDYATFKRAAQGLGDIEGYDLETDRTSGASHVPTTVAYTTTGFFAFAGVAPYRGRFFSAEENVYGSPTPVAVLSYHYWRSRLGGNEAVLGSAILIDSTMFRVIGVTRPDFEGLDVDAVEIWAPMAARPPGMEGPWWTGGFQIMQLFARVPRHNDLSVVESRLNTQLRIEHPSVVARDSRFRLTTAPLLRARSGSRIVGEEDRTTALVVRLSIVALLVLLIATLNAASLLLMRTLKRRKEIAIRIALGVSGWRLLGQSLVEGLVVALAGAAVAILIALWSGRLLRALLLPQFRWTATVIDHRTIALAIVLAVLFGIFAALAPAGLVTASNPFDALKSGGVDTGRTRSRLRVALLVVQTTLCMTMLSAAGIFIESLHNAATFNVGFDADRLVVFKLYAGSNASIDAVVDRIKGLPAVSEVSAGYVGSEAGIPRSEPIELSNGDSLPMSSGLGAMNVDSRFAAATGMHVLRGRFFNSGDFSGSEPVAVISRAAADAYWRDQDPLESCVRLGGAKEPCRRIVGVIADSRWRIIEPPQKIFYAPVSQAPLCCHGGITVRTRERATPATLSAINVIIRSSGIDLSYPTFPQLASDRFDQQLRPWRIGTAMFLLFGILALAAAGAGIYGLVGYDVAQRTHEFGVRITLGASVASILGLVLSSGLRVMAIGLVLGVGSAVAIGRVVASLLFETSPYDPRVLAGTVMVLTAAAVGASVVPAWRATRVNPIEALRVE